MHTISLSVFHSYRVYCIKVFTSEGGDSPPPSPTSFRTLINNSVPFFIVIRGSLITVDLLTYPWMKFAPDANTL